MRSWWYYILAVVEVLVLLKIANVAAWDTREIPKFKTETDKQILDAVLDSQLYDHRMRPNNFTVINVTVLLLSLSSPDESSLKYEVEFLLHQNWEDPRLKFDDGGRYRYLNAIMHDKKIWIPDIYFIKHGEFKQPLAPVHMSLKVFSNGTVLYITRRSMVLNCQGNLQIFPFDNPKCPFAIESVSHESSELELMWAKSDMTITAATSLRYHNAYLVKNETGMCDDHHTWRGNYSCLRVLLVFTRDKSFYFSTVFGPGMVLVTSSFISFWLDINAVPARVMIGVTTMLNFCTTTNSFRSTLPVVSNLTAMNLWDGVCMFFIYASMLEFIIVNYLYRKYPHTAKTVTAHQQTEPIRPSSTLAQVGRWCGNYEQTNTHKVTPDSNSNDPQATTRDMMPTHETNQVNPNHQSVSGGGGRATSPVSFFGWLKRPHFISEDTLTRQRISKNIDNVSKILFPLLFGLFIFGYFLTYAAIKPNHKENWELLSGSYKPS